MFEIHHASVGVDSQVFRRGERRLAAETAEVVVSPDREAAFDSVPLGRVPCQLAQPQVLSKLLRLLARESSKLRNKRRRSR